jgi:hypothetical protein
MILRIPRRTRMVLMVTVALEECVVVILFVRPLRRDVCGEYFQTPVGYPRYDYHTSALDDRLDHAGCNCDC